MVQQFAVAAVNRGMVGNRGTKTTNQNVSGLCLCGIHAVKTGRLQIIQIEIISLLPPVLPPRKIRHLNTRQMVRIAEQGVTVRHAMLKCPPGEKRHAAKFVYPVIADQPPRQATLHLQAAINIAEERQAIGMAVYQGHHIARRLRLEVICRIHTEIQGRFSGKILAGKIPLPGSRVHHPAARFSRRTRSSMRQDSFFHGYIHQERRLMERKQPMRGRLLRSSQPVRHLLQASFAGSAVGLSNSSATGGPA